MIKVAIITKQMVIGGTEKALLPMLKQFNPEKYEVDLYLQELGGALFDEIPEWINPIKMPTYSDLSKKEYFKHPIHFAKSVFARFRLSEKNPFYIQCEHTCSCMPIVEKEYDYVISYHAPDAVPFFYAVKNIKAKKRIMWLHFDVEKTNAVNSLAKKYFEKYDRIFSVCQHAKDMFDKNYPELADRSFVFYNLVDVESILNKIKDAPTFNDRFDGKRLLSLGRLDDQKGYDIFLPVVKKLVDENYKIKFYICGNGNRMEALKNQAKDLGIEGNIELFGMLSNPYRYLKDCDIYVQPSRFEGFCTTTNEARMFFKPVVVTDVCGMREQFNDHENGSITGVDSDSLYVAVKELLDNDNLCKKYSDNLEKLNLNQKIDIETIFKGLM